VRPTYRYITLTVTFESRLVYVTVPIELSLIISSSATHDSPETIVVYLQKFQPGLVSEWRPPAFLDRRPTPERAARTSSHALAPTSRAHASMALFMSPFASLGAARPRPRSSAAFGCGRARPSPSRGPVVHRRRSADDASRGALTIARGKKKKGFAELMGGDDADDAVAVKKKGAASESDRCPCGGGAENLPYSRCCKPFHKGEAYPQDCVTLMRSRFTGYAKGEGEYVVKTTHPENPIFKDGAKAESGKVVSTLAEDVRMTCRKVRFYDLEIVSDKAGKDGEHMVGFRYKCRVV